MPQVGLTASFVHYNELPTSLIAEPNGTQLAEHIGVANTLIPTLSVTQAIFSPNLLYAATSSHIYVKQAQQSVDSAKIGVVASVSKAFYNLLLTLEEINVLKEDTVQLAQNLRDSYHQYVGGNNKIGSVSLRSPTIKISSPITTLATGIGRHGTPTCQ